MDSFETVIAMLLTRCGYWSITSYRVILTPEEKRKIGRPSNPRVECKSFLDSRGVLFRNKKFEHPTRYKLFSDETLRDVILRRLAIQLEECGLCRSKPTVKLCLAAGRIANQTDRKDMNEWFAANHFELFDDKWIFERLQEAEKACYENDVAHIVSKILIRGLLKQLTKKEAIIHREVK